MRLEELLTERYRKGGCMYCKQDATKGYIWADGRGIISVCNNHIDKAKNQIEVVNKDKIVGVRDL